jgi:hypothetical protein
MVGMSLQPLTVRTNSIAPFFCKEEPRKTHQAKALALHLVAELALKLQVHPLALLKFAQGSILTRLTLFLH